MTPRARPRTAAERLARLAGRLTDRDRRLCHLLAEHHVLTTHQLAGLAFPTLDTAEHRLVILHRLAVLDRFRPFRPTGSAPYHYVLGPAGAAVLAAERGADPHELGYRRDRALAIAHSHHLQHLVGVNGFFAALAAAARQYPDTELLEWWPERRCAQRWGAIVRPDGFGRWRDGTAEVDFFLEHDRGTEPLARLTRKLAGYADLAAASAITTPTLFWFQTPGREATARRALAHPPVPVATASALSAASPAGPVWLPLGTDGPRRRLTALRPSQSTEQPRR